MISDYIIKHTILRRITHCLFVPLLFVFQDTLLPFSPSETYMTLLPPTRPSVTCSLLIHLPLLLMGVFVRKDLTSIKALIF